MGAEEAAGAAVSTFEWRWRRLLLFISFPTFLCGA